MVAVAVAVGRDVVNYLVALQFYSEVPPITYIRILSARSCISGSRP